MAGDKRACDNKVLLCCQQLVSSINESMVSFLGTRFDPGACVKGINVTMCRIFHNISNFVAAATHCTQYNVI